MRRLPLLVVFIAVLFCVAMAWLVGAALSPRTVPTYTLRSGGPAPHDSQALDTVTLDARDPDRWQFFAFAAGPLALPDTGGWDIAVRRFHVIVAGEAASIDSVPFDAVRTAPSTGFVPTTFDRDTVNQAIARWYRYNMFSHLLRPVPQIYVIRSRGGRSTKMEFLSYYCPGPEPGCLTIRYAPLP